MPDIKPPDLGGGGKPDAGGDMKDKVIDTAAPMAMDAVAPGSGQLMKAAGIKPSEMLKGGGGGGGGGGENKKEGAKGPAEGAGGVADSVGKIAEKAGEKPSEDISGDLQAAIGGVVGIAKEGMKMSGMDKGIGMATDPAGGASKAMSAGGGGDMPPKPPIPSPGGGAAPGADMKPDIGPKMPKPKM